MTRPVPACFAAALAATLASGCASAPALPDRIAGHLAEAPEDVPARLVLSGSSIVQAAVAVGPGAIPAPVRAAISAVVPQGDVTFQGREWGPRGFGFRIEKRYVHEAIEHTRTALIAPDGDVLERAHSVPIGQVPKPILTAALQAGSTVTTALIVSGPDAEEGWRCHVTDRLGRRYLVEVDLGGTLTAVHRRVAANVDV